MSVSRPARCLFSKPLIPTIPSRMRYRNFQTSPNLYERRKPRYPSIKASDMGLVDRKPQRPAAQELFKAYSDEEKALLAKKYTPEQIRAIEAGEGAILAEDLDRQGVIRTDIGSLPYLDDFSHYRSVVDKKAPDNTPVDPNARFMTPDELAKSFSEYYIKLSEENPGRVSKYNYDDAESGLIEHVDPQEFETERLNFLRADYDSPRYMGANGPIPSGPNLLAPTIPKKISLNGTAPIAENGDEVKDPSEAQVDPQDPDGIFDRLRKQTGIAVRDIRKLQTKILVKHYVSKQTRLGKVRSLYCLAVAGNGDGLLGLGQAKGQEQTNTMNLARMAAIRNMKPIPRYEDRTIYGDVDAKVSGVVVQLMARSPGFGLRCQSLIFEMARAAGIHDLAARVPRSRNKMNTVKAAYNAMMKQRIPDEVARGRGRKLVDVRKVYYAGLV